MSFRAAPLLLVAALTGCGEGGEGDKVSPELPRVSLEVKGMS
jgi:hypothetical protein